VTYSRPTAAQGSALYSTALRSLAARDVPGRFVATVYQTHVRVHLVVVDTETDEYHRRFPFQITLDGVVNLSEWEATSRAGTHHRLIEHGWMPRSAERMEPGRVAGWQQHEYGNSLTVDPIGGMRDRDGNRLGGDR
jgi:hypothetical protein